ncbi:SGNH/GDSL hydrolase family protein [Actomonas aquatica]|uniref:SGNH/GDSL hydrolase family protein n=1 Tax=Actomonas aquatica TaxID=2866162 RepID=A0ABZ1C4M2_9BACT|nr:SGNH/GDSL hydrolase family protein [Opitutus sp. WL0086]WRQ86436.1 SGNH/GDSL hydrolase family protein [Opitutus sp. WL0086]
MKLPLRSAPLLGALLALVFGNAALAAEPLNPHWEEEVAGIEAREQKAPVPAGGILFTGSSSIRLWKTLAADYPELPVINRGFGGSQISDLIAYFDRLVLPWKPRQIVVYSGTNDISDGEAAEQVLADWAMLCGMIERELPGTRIALIAAAPNPARWAQRETQERFNTLAAAFCARNGYDFIDVWTPMLGPDGEPSRDIYVEDKLHMNAAGYAMWREIVAPYLQ